MRLLGKTISIEQIREKIAVELRARVVGPNANQRTQEIMDAPGERWFAEDRPIRLVHGDASMFIGGLRALLLQSLHPLAMAGVANYSDYRKDPWGRLQRTADFLAATSFGPADEAQRIVDRVKAVHLKVNGVASDGRKYSATDPHLLKWVHIAEIDSFLCTYQKFSKAPLDQKGRDGYVKDAAFVARAVGVIDPPETEAELRAMTNRDRMRESPVVISSTMPSAKYSCSLSPLMLAKGSTAMEGLSEAAPTRSLALASLPRCAEEGRAAARKARTG